MGEVVLKCISCGEEYSSAYDLLFIGDNSDTDGKVGHCKECGVSSTSHIKAISRD